MVPLYTAAKIHYTATSMQYFIKGVRHVLPRFKIREILPKIWDSKTDLSIYIALLTISVDQVHALYYSIIKYVVSMQVDRAGSGLGIWLYENNYG